jgi:hypothetical protein
MVFLVPAPVRRLSLSRETVRLTSVFANGFKSRS